MEAAVLVAVYMDEFKRESVKQVNEGCHPGAKVAKRLFVSIISIYAWLRDRSGMAWASKIAETVEGWREDYVRPNNK
jgi:hypothetical protein